MQMPKLVLFLGLLAGIVGFGDHPKAAGPTATFHVIGDLPGGGALTLVRDATRVGGGIYATGSLVTRFCPSGCALPQGTDTNFLWRFDGSNAPTLEKLPDIDFNLEVNGLNGGFAITPDGRYIASQARIAVADPVFHFETRAVRVDTTPPLSPASNLIIPGGGNALGISSDGTILSGQAPGTRAARFDASVQPPTTSLIPTLSIDTQNTVGPRGTSADGNVIVGVSIGPSPTSFRRAYRYVHGSGVSGIPLLPGGTNNNALAVSPDGDLVLVVGNGTGAPNSEPYLYRASNGAIQRLGSPNPNLLEAWGPGARICSGSDGTCNGRLVAAGMTADGSVVVMNFGSPILQQNPSVFGGQYAYFRNQHGWFHLTSALLANGVDLGLSGWDPQTLFISGVSSDGTLVFGAGAQNGVVKGFVADFPAGALASFNPAPSPPEDPSIVGAWNQPDDPIQTVVFTGDGVYYHIGRMEFGGNVTTGFERGLYTYSGGVLTLTTLFDTNGEEGFSDGNGSTFPVDVTGNTLTFVDDPEESVLQRVVGGAGSIVGGWLAGNPTQPNSSFVTVFFDSGQVFQATDNPEFGGPEAGHGTYTWGPNITCAPFTHELNLFPLPGDPGSPDLHNCGTLASNELEIHALDDDGHSEFHLTRVIDPRTPLITSALDAVATVGLPFAYQITATNSPTTFGAFGLPPWLNFDPDTGLISGTPPAVTTVDIRIEASNSLSTITGRNRLSIVVIAPVIVSEGATTVTPIPPDQPGETPPITIEFENVTNGGEISVVSIDPEADPEAPEPPSGFSLGDDPVYFEIIPSEELTFTGPVTVCFSYEGITFSGFPRLLHYDEELETWVDITTSVDTENQIICGLTASFSPFVIAATALDAKGFHSPIKPVAGELNTVKGGSTVALKFNVFGDGNVEITDPTTLTNPDGIGAKFETAAVTCEGGTPENWDVITTTGNTGLRYDSTSGNFVQNWKTPTVPGCYLVQLKGDGLLLSALFKVR
jgi:hypothetical protein